MIAVTAVDEHDKLLSVANQGPHIALAAPGVNVIEVGPRGTYNLTTGTSVASAHVSGVAALILERNPKIDVTTLENVLYSTAKDLGAPGRDSEFGYGLVDPYRALEAAEAPDVKASTAARLNLAPRTARSCRSSQLLLPTDRGSHRGGRRRRPQSPHRRRRLQRQPRPKLRLRRQPHRRLRPPKRRRRPKRPTPIRRRVPRNVTCRRPLPNPSRRQSRSQSGRAAQFQ